MRAFVQHRKTFIAWLAILAVLWHAVPFAAPPGPAGDARALHLDICSAAGVALESPRGGSTPGDRDGGAHECALCVSALAQIADARRDDPHAPVRATPVSGVAWTGLAPRPAAALPPPACGPPRLAS